MEMNVVSCAQAYFIFSIGNVRPIITAEYPNCWKTYKECGKTLTQAPDYTQIIGACNFPCRLEYMSLFLVALHKENRVNVDMSE